MQDFLQVDHAGKTDVGVKRSHNQDAYAVQLAADEQHWQEAGHVFVVSDGMGGHAVGEKAATKAANDIPHMYSKYVADGPGRALRRAFLETNASIHAVGQENPEFKGLGTTSTALILRPDGAWIGHVGDSRAYRIRDGRIAQLTFDHSLVWFLAEKEGIPPEDLPEIKKNVIIRSLGPDALVEVDVEGPHPLQSGDTFLLCSDGLSNQIGEEEMGVIVSSFPPQDACELLIELANLRGGPDNITVVIARLGEVKPPPPDPEPPKGIFRDLARAWARAVPWPLTLLLLGFFLAIGFIVWRLAELPGSGVLFVVAALLIGSGLVGLGFHVLKQRQEDQREPEEPVTLNVYRDYPCELSPHLMEKFSKFGDELRQQIEERGWQADMNAYDKARSTAEQLAAQNPRDAFRHLCHSIHILARVFNQNRNREEAFQPKWDLAPAE